MLKYVKVFHKGFLMPSAKCGINSAEVSSLAYLNAADPPT